MGQNPGASPRIIDDVVWERVQVILNDPERRKRRRTPRPYPLRRRLKCGVCGSAMVGQTMTSKGKEYRYYGCRHLYDRTTGHDRSARYVRGDALEAGIGQEIRRILSSPEIVLHELQRSAHEAPDPTAIAGLVRELRSLDDREKRLKRLFSFGEVDEGSIRQETGKLENERAVGTPSVHAPWIDATQLQHFDEAPVQRVRVVGAWLDQADEGQRRLVLKALQIGIVATRESTALTGVLPLEAPKFFIEQYAA
jgi:hypothetical protein